MQYMIDTNTDSAADIYRLAKFLADTYYSRETDAPRRAPEPPPAPVAAVEPPPPPPAEFPGTFAAPVTPAPPAAVAPTPAAPELDSAGKPWDPAIHASNRAKKIDGTWKTKRGTGTADAGNAPPPPVPPPPAQYVAPPPPPMPPAPTPAPSAAGASAPPVTGPAPSDFRGLMQKIQQLSVAGRLSTDQVNEALATVGLQPTEMAQLIGNTLLIGSVNAALERALAA